MEILAVVLKSLAGLVFIGASGQKLAGSSGVFAPVWGALAGLLLAGVMTGAIVSHVRIGDSVSSFAPTSVLLVFSLAVSSIHFLA